MNSCTGALGCQHVPDAVADDECRFYSDVQSSGGGEKEVRIRLAVFHLVPRHDGDSVAVDIDPVEKRPRDFAPPAGRDRPWDADIGQIGEKLACARQELDILRGPLEGGGMEAPQLFDPRGIDMVTGLAQQHAAEQAAAYPDLAMDASNREVDPLRCQRFAPGQHG